MRMLYKNLLLAVAAFSTAGALSAQCNELFISEYVEGTGNNKAIEIYNPGNQPVDLTQYRLTRWQNGTSTWQNNYSDTLSGTLPPNGVVVCILDRRNPNGTGVDTPAAAELQAKANLFLSADYNRNFSMSFNGDDAVSLDKRSGNAWVPVDIFGKIGERPRNAWTDSFPYNMGIGLWLSANKTLIRKPEVTGGVRTNPTHFNAKAQYLVYGANTFDSLGSHICDCNKFAASTTSRPAVEWAVFPNPVSNGNLTVVAESDGVISLFDLSGRQMQPVIRANAKGHLSSLWEIETAGLSKGTYILQIQMKDGRRAASRVGID
jgi:hypothetical protein